ncbi:hypothetical protein N310_10269, partial [Acanthisitta chloris]
SNSKNKIIEVFWVSIGSSASFEAPTFPPHCRFQPSA